MINKKEMGERLRDLRLSQKMSQKEFADAIGKTQTSISQIESGEYGLSHDTIFTIKEKFNLESSWIYTGEISAKSDNQESSIDYKGKYFAQKKIVEMMLRQNDSLIKQLEDYKELVKY